MPTDPLHPTNRIEVDLKILQDRNLERLHEFADKWDKSVDVLVKAIGNLGEIVQQGMPDMAQSSRAEPLPRSVARLGGVVNEADEIPGAGNRGEASIAPTEPTPADDTPPPDMFSRDWWDRFSFNPQQSGNELTDFEKAQFHLGSIGEGPLASLRYLSYITGEGAQGRSGALGSVLSTISNLSGAGARAGTYAESMGDLWNQAAGRFGMPPIQSFFTPGASISAQQFGINANAGTQPGGAFGFMQGLSGLPIVGPLANMFSGAGLKGIEANWNAGLLSWFGFNPDLTMQQARDIEATLNQYGWGQDGNGAQTDMLRNILTNYTQKYRGAISPEEMMNAGFDAATRFGTSSIDDLKASFDNLANSASAANMSLSAFSKSLDEVAPGVSQQYGTPISAARLAVQSLSQSTGLSPQAAGQMLQDSNFWLGVARSHTPLWQLAEPKTAARANLRIGMEGLMGLMPQMVGSHAQWQAAAAAAKRGDHGPMRQLETRLELLYHMNPQLFGGLTPQQVINQEMYGRGMETRAVATAKLYHANTADQMITQMMRAGVSRQKLQDFSKWRHDHKQQLQEAIKAEKEGHLGKLNKYVADERQKALQILGQSQKKQQMQTAAKTSMTFDLTPQAKQLVKLLSDSKGGKSGSNSWANYGRSAFGTIGGMIGGPLGSALGGAAGGEIGSLAHSAVGGIESLGSDIGSLIP